MTRGLRLARLALHLMQGMLTIAVLFPFYSPARRNDAVKRWSQSLLNMLGVVLHVHGKIPRGRAQPAMLVANHVSWLDIYAINAAMPVRFVAKSEVRRWPVIGWLSANTGTLFIKRARRHDTARINHEIVAAMRNGDVVAVFPEGTTSDGSGVLRFHSSLLQPALLAQARVHPVALRFECDDGSLCVDAAYCGDKSLWDTLLLILAQPMIHARVWFLEPLSDPMDRRALGEAAHRVIADHLKS